MPLSLAMCRAAIAPALQRTAEDESHQANLQVCAESLRKDVSRSKVRIVTGLMGLTQEEAARFLPVCNGYARSRQQLGAEGVALVRADVKAGGHLSDRLAHSMTRKNLEVEARWTEVR